MADQRHPLAKYNPISWLLGGGRNPEEVSSGINFRDLLHPSLREANPNMAKTPLYLEPPNILGQLFATNPNLAGYYSSSSRGFPPYEPYATIVAGNWGEGIRSAEKYYSDDPNPPFYADDTIMHELGHMIDEEALTPEMRRHLMRIIEDTEVEGRKPYGSLVEGRRSLEEALSHHSLYTNPTESLPGEMFTRLLTQMSFWPKPEEEGYQEAMERRQTPRSAPTRFDEESNKHYNETGELLKEAWVPEPPQGYPFSVGMREGSPLWEFIRTAIGEDPRDLHFRLQDRLRQVPFHQAKQDYSGKSKSVLVQLLDYLDPASSIEHKPGIDEYGRRQQAERNARAKAKKHYETESLMKRLSF